jgi:hypothetical protein
VWSQIFGSDSESHSDAFRAIPRRSGASWSHPGLIGDPASREGYWCFSESFARLATDTPSAFAIPSTVAQDGLPSPRSIKESMFLVIPASPARVSKLSPCLLRSSRIALPSALCDFGF